MKRPRRNHTATYKAKVALAALRGDKTLAELSEKFDVHASQVVQWKAQLLDGAMGVFLTSAEKRETQGPSVKDMQAKIGQLALENDFLAGALGRIDGASGYEFRNASLGAARASDDPGCTRPQARGVFCLHRVGEAGGGRGLWDHPPGHSISW